MIWQQASGICPSPTSPVPVFTLEFLLVQTKLSLCFPVFLYWVTLCYMIWSKKIQCKETHVPSHWKYEDCSFLLPCGKESRSGVQKSWRKVWCHHYCSSSTERKENIQQNRHSLLVEQYRGNNTLVKKKKVCWLPVVKLLWKGILKIWPFLKLIASWNLKGKGIYLLKSSHKEQIKWKYL